MFDDQQRRALYFKELSHLKDELLKNYERAGARDTGSFERSLEIQIVCSLKDKISLLGAKHTPFIELGRASGKFPPLPLIEGWVKRKLGISDPHQVKQRAFLIARKMAKEGSLAYRKKHRLGMISDPIEEFLREGSEKIAKSLSGYVVSKIGDAF